MLIILGCHKVMQEYYRNCRGFALKGCSAIHEARLQWYCQNAIIVIDEDHSVVVLLNINTHSTVFVCVLVHV